MSKETAFILYSMNSQAPFTYPAYELGRDNFEADLRWLVDPSTDLVTHIEGFTAFNLHLQNTQLNDDFLAQPVGSDELIKLQQSKPQRLGHYFEHTAERYLRYLSTQSSSQVKNVQRAIRLYKHTDKGRDTLGELDFVYETPNGLNHLEVAVKFYLSYFDGSSWQWLGPDARDSLPKKLNHMANHQLPLSKNPALQLSISKQLFWVKGALFQPWLEPIAPTPMGINTLACQNYWLHFKQLKHFLKQNQKNWRAITKAQWLGCGPTNTELDLSEVNEKRALMLVETRALTPQRVMVVPDHWPHVE